MFSTLHLMIVINKSCVTYINSADKHSNLYSSTIFQTVFQINYSTKDISQKGVTPFFYKNKAYKNISLRGLT